MKFTGEIRHLWQAGLERSNEEMVILRTSAREELLFEDVSIHQGDIVVQYFPRNEWVCIQEYLNPSGKLKGWYRNIAEPPLMQGSTIMTKDLIVDIFVSPDFRYKDLDMNELEHRKSLLQEAVVEKI